MRQGFIIICQKANGDKCSGNTCLHQALRNSSAGRGMACVSGKYKELFLWTLCLWDRMWMQTYCTFRLIYYEQQFLKSDGRFLQKSVILQHDNDFHHTAPVRQ